MIVCVPVDGVGAVDPRWGRADRLALAETEDGHIVGWREVDVMWSVLHDQATEGSHHARVVRFLRENGVEVVVAGHMGDGMAHTLGKMGLRVHLGASGDARGAVETLTKDDPAADSPE